MTLPIFHDHSPAAPWHVTDEPAHIIDSLGYVRLIYKPKKDSPSTVAIAGFTETTNSSPGLTEFYIDYQDQTQYRTATQLVKFNLSQVGNSISAIYLGVGQRLYADNLNEIKSHVENTGIHLTAGQATQIAGAVVTTDPRLSDARTPVGHNQDWSTITGKPTTIATSEISDVYTKAQVDALDAVNDWAISTAYTLNQLVVSAGILYRCTSAHTSTVTFDATKFTELGGTSSGGSNLLTLLHTNNEATTSEITFDYLYDGVIIPDFTRHTNKLKIGTISSGNGQVQVQITDGTNTVTQNMTVINSVGRKKDSVNIDCSTLADVSTGKYWNVTIYAKAVTGDYTLSKFTLQGIPVDFMSGQTMIQTNPMTSVSTNIATMLDTRNFPINYAIDNSCQIRFLACVTLGTGVTSAELRCRLTTSNGSTVSTNECLLSVSASGIVQGYIDFPNIVAPTVKVEVLGRVVGGTGVVTLGHYECWMEV